eukprot:gene39194-47689_t
MPKENESPSTSDKIVKFLDDNGGKLVLLAIGFIVAWGYTYYESMQDRDRTEKSVLHDGNIEPYEIQMLRATNSVPLVQYKLLMDEFARQGWTWRTEVPYAEVIRVTERVLPPLKLGYLLDRAVYHHATRTLASLPEQRSGSNAADVKIPVRYFVSLLNLCMESKVDARLEGLFYACSTLHNAEEQDQQEGVQVLRRGVLVELVQSLVDTDQIPPEKQVEETGVKYPIRLHRRKTPERMVEAHETDGLKIKQQKEAYSQSEFVQVMKSKYICAWASCYR